MKIPSIRHPSGWKPLFSGSVSGGGGLLLHLVLIVLIVLFGMGAGNFYSSEEKQPAFGFHDVVREAEDMAYGPYEDPPEVPDFLKRLDYDAWRDIRFRPEKSLWRKERLPFEVQFFHTGFLYRWPVEIHIVDGASVTPVRFRTDYFDYGKNDFEKNDASNLSFAGFRIHHPINTQDYFDEFAVFLGASYYRMVAEHQRYGLSARGVAVDTALETGEEFPFFKKYWIVRPKFWSKKVTIYALLDSRSVTGAYQFDIRPGEETVAAVECTLFKRRGVKKIGIAPLTSMFLYGENDPNSAMPDFRPEVHDSDGLLIQTASDEMIWRPLVNPDRLAVHSFEGENVRGFGLLQRDMNFDHYQDLETRYDLRPSVWIEPGGPWGSGRVELVQIPSPEEKHDNVVAYWVPDADSLRGDRLHYVYNVRWFFPKRHSSGTLGYAADTRVEHRKEGQPIRFVLNFEGWLLKNLPAGTLVEPRILISGSADFSNLQVCRNEVTGGWRLVFEVHSKKDSALTEFAPGGVSSAEITASLWHKSRPITETWSYVVQI